MKLINIPVLCAIPRLYAAAEKLLTADPEPEKKGEEKKYTTEEVNIMLRAREEAMQKTVNEELQRAADTAAALYNSRAPAVTREELEIELDAMCGDEKNMVEDIFSEDYPDIPGKYEIAPDDGFAPSTDDLDSRIAKTQELFKNQSPKTIKNPKPKQYKKARKPQDNRKFTMEEKRDVTKRFTEFDEANASKKSPHITREEQTKVINIAYGTDKSSTALLAMAKEVHIIDKTIIKEHNKPKHARLTFK